MLRQLAITLGIAVGCAAGGILLTAGLIMVLSGTVSEAYGPVIGLLALILPGIASSFVSGFVIGMLLGSSYECLKVALGMPTIPALGIVYGISRIFGTSAGAAYDTCLCLLVGATVPSLLLTWLGLYLGSRRYWRRRAGYCRGCEYDLTGNVSGVCPECGRVIDGQKVQQSGR